MGIRSKHLTKKVRRKIIIMRAVFLGLALLTVVAAMNLDKVNNYDKENVAQVNRVRRYDGGDHNTTMGYLDDEVEVEDDGMQDGYGGINIKLQQVFNYPMKN